MGLSECGANSSLLRQYSASYLCCTNGKTWLQTSIQKFVLKWMRDDDYDNKIYFCTFQIYHTMSTHSDSTAHAASFLCHWETKRSQWMKYKIKPLCDFIINRWETTLLNPAAFIIHSAQFNVPFESAPRDKVVEINFQIVYFLCHHQPKKKKR